MTSEDEVERAIAQASALNFRRRALGRGRERVSAVRGAALDRAFAAPRRSARVPREHREEARLHPRCDRVPRPRAGHFSRSSCGRRPAALHRQGDGGDAIAASVGLRSFRFAETDDERLKVLDDVVREALASAAGALRAALQIKRGDRNLLERVCAIHEAAGEFVEAVNVSVSLAESEPDPTARARAFVAAADLCASKAGNVDRAVALYEAAIADDPTTPGAFEAIEKVLLDSGDVEGTERAYVRQIDRLSARNERRAQGALLRSSRPFARIASPISRARRRRSISWSRCVRPRSSCA